jgi:hypothetical protein
VLLGLPAHALQPFALHRGLPQGLHDSHPVRGLTRSSARSLPGLLLVSLLAPELLLAPGFVGTLARQLGVHRLAGGSGEDLERPVHLDHPLLEHLALRVGSRTLLRPDPRRAPLDAGAQFPMLPGIGVSADDEGPAGSTPSISADPSVSRADRI